MTCHALDAFDGGGDRSTSGLLDRLRAMFGGGRRDGIASARDPVALARALGAARRRRSELFDADLFAEPAWDLLLELYIATREGAELTPSIATTAIDLPVSVSLRWIRELETRGLVDRHVSRDEYHRDFLLLSARGMQKMETLLRTMLIR